MPPATQSAATMLRRPPQADAGRRRGNASPGIRTPSDDRQNGFGAFRLFFASLVIFEHAGFQSGKIVPGLGAIGFGSAAVDGFFLISGYLITGSVISSDTGRFFWKRILRIYPAFIVCSLILLFVVRPLAGGTMPTIDHLKGPVLWMALLFEPVSGGAFAGLRSSHLDGSMWTIAYEFRCYILSALFGFAGLYRRPRLYLVLTVLLLAAYPLSLIDAVGKWDRSFPLWWAMTLGTPIHTVRLLGVFMVGGCFKLFSPPLTGRNAAGCAMALAPLVFVPKFGEIALATLGGYALFWVALQLDWKPLRTINAKNDISYGVYLYAWPITNLLLWYWQSVPLFTLMLLTLAGALACGTLSWHLVEKRVLAFKSLRWQRQAWIKAGRIPVR